MNIHPVEFRQMTYGELMLYSMAHAVRRAEERYEQALFTSQICNHSGMGSKSRMTPEKMLGLGSQQGQTFDRDSANAAARDALESWFEEIEEEFKEYR